MARNEPKQNLVGGPFGGWTFDLDGQDAPRFIEHEGHRYLRTGPTTLTWSPKDSPAEQLFQREQAAERAGQQVLAGRR